MSSSCGSAVGRNDILTMKMAIMSTATILEAINTAGNTTAITEITVTRENPVPCVAS